MGRPKITHKFVKTQKHNDNKPPLPLFKFFWLFGIPSLETLLSRTPVGQQVLSEIAQTAQITLDTQQLSEYLNRVKSLISSLDLLSTNPNSLEEVKGDMKQFPTENPKSIRVKVTFTVIVPPTPKRRGREKPQPQQQSQQSQQQSPPPQSTQQGTSPEASPSELSPSPEGKTQTFSTVFEVKLPSLDILHTYCRQAISFVEGIKGVQHINDATINELTKYRSILLTYLGKVIKEMQDVNVSNLTSQLTQTENEEFVSVAQAIADKIINIILSEYRVGWGWRIEEGTTPEEVLGQIYDLKALISRLRNVSKREAEVIFKVLLNKIRSSIQSQLRGLTSTTSFGEGVKIGSIGEEEEEIPPPRLRTSILHEEEEEVEVKRRALSVVQEFLLALRNNQELREEIGEEQWRREWEKIRSFLEARKNLSIYGAIKELVRTDELNYRLREMFSRFVDRIDANKKYKEVLEELTVSELSSLSGTRIPIRKTSMLYKQIKVKPPKKPKPIKKLPPLPKAVEQILLWWKNLPVESRKVISGILHSYLVETDPDVRKALERELVETAKRLGIPIKALRALEDLPD